MKTDVRLNSSLRCEDRLMAIVLESTPFDLLDSCKKKDQWRVLQTATLTGKRTFTEKFQGSINGSQWEFVRL
jgi:hypothetical protein